MSDRTVSEALRPRPTGSARDDESELEELRQRIRALRSDWSRSDERIRRRLQQRPLLSVVVAVALGFVAGRVIGRG
jgi:hypothetical protein